MKNLLFLILAILLMVATRGHTSLFAVAHIPDFTIPALFIAGVYFRSFYTALALIVSAVAIDNYAIVHQGISAHCITPAYSVLPLTYYAIFYFSKYITPQKFVQSSVVVAAITGLQWFVATMSYYAFTQTFAEQGFTGFGEYLAKWSLVEIPPTLGLSILSLGIAGLSIKFFATSLPSKNSAH